VAASVEWFKRVNAGRVGLGTDLDEPVDGSQSRTQQARRVPELITMNAFGLLIEPTDELGLFMREVLMKHLDYTVRLPRPDLFTTAFDAAYEARYVLACAQT
jgi:hypothetical protein